jgi:hypothetical protein
MIILNDFDLTLKSGVEPTGVDDFYYTLTNYDNLNPKHFFKNQKTVDEINRAIKLLEEYENFLKSNELMEFI